MGYMLNLESWYLDITFLSYSTILPSGKIIILFIFKFSTKDKLCDTTIIDPLNSLNILAIIVCVSGSKWLVGSSNNNKLAPLKVILAKATRDFSPGDNTETFL